MSFDRMNIDGPVMDVDHMDILFQVGKLRNWEFGA